MGGVLAGCKDSSMDIVKKYKLSIDTSMSVGEALDGSPMCESVKWEESVENPKIVFATCEVSQARLKKEFDALNEVYENVVKAVKKERNDDVNKWLETLKKYLDDYKNKDSKDIDTKTLAEIIKKHCVVEKEPTEANGYMPEYPKCKNNEIEKEVVSTFGLSKTHDRLPISVSLSQAAVAYQQMVYAEMPPTKYDIVNKSHRQINEKPTPLSSMAYLITFKIYDGDSVGVSGITRIDSRGSFDIRNPGSQIAEFYKR